MRVLRHRSLAALAALLFAGIAVSAQGADRPTKPYVVKVHAEWCGTCTALEPTWEKIEAEYGSEVRMVVFDVSNRKTVAEAKATAKLLGLTEIFNEYKGSTGTIAVLDPYRNPVAVMKGELDFTAYKEAIAKAAAT